MLITSHLPHETHNFLNLCYVLLNATFLRLYGPDQLSHSLYEYLWLCLLPFSHPLAERDTVLHRGELGPPFCQQHWVSCLMLSSFPNNSQYLVGF